MVTITHHGADVDDDNQLTRGNNNNDNAPTFNNLTASTMSEYLLFTTTRYDKGLVKFSWNNDEDKPCPFLLRANHYQRLVSAAWDHEWTEASKTLKDYEKFKRLLDEAVQTYKTSSNDADPIALRASLLPLSPHCSIAQILLVDANYNRPRRCLSDHLRTRATICR